MKRVISILLIIMLLPSFVVSVFAADETTIREAFNTTADYMASLGTPSAGSTGGEWMVLGFGRSDREVADAYYDSVLAYVNEKIDANGRIHKNKCTDNCRFIVALTAIGKDPTNVGGHNLLSGLNDLGYIRKVGVSGIIWTLIAFDCGQYEMPAGIDRDTLVRALLEYQIPTGGWANSGDIPDPDVTSMAIQALAPYREDYPEVRTAIDTAVQILSDMQDNTGSFPGQYGASSESISQVIVALTSLGIDPNTDERFVKDGVSAIDGLISYYVEGGGFKHISSGKRDPMATEQGYYAMVAYFRLVEGKRALYDMQPEKSDVPQQPLEPNIPQTPPTNSNHQEPDVPQMLPAEPTQQVPQAQEHNRQISFGWVWLVFGAAIALITVCLVCKKKLGKKKFSNAIMVVAILLVAALGIGFAIQMMDLEHSVKLGSEFKITAITDNRLVSHDNTENICTITIRCDTVLNNLNLLDEAKIPYVPADGVILTEITVEFTPGESVFDVMRRVCEVADIPLEYSWTPLYDSYYVEGIYHLYELDCGADSGWMYQVNGTFPNYGCSSFKVKPGDKIQWRYSCVGLGADLDADVMEG